MLKFPKSKTTGVKLQPVQQKAVEKAKKISKTPVPVDEGKTKANFTEGFERKFVQIPTEELEQLAAKYGKAQLVVLSLDTRQKVHLVNTYGLTVQDKRSAAARSNLLAKLDWDLCIEQGSIVGQKHFDPKKPLLGRVRE